MKRNEEFWSAFKRENTEQTLNEEETTRTNNTGANEKEPEENKETTTSAGKGTKARIYNLIIVDESGSMGHLVSPTLLGINKTIESIKDAQKEFADTQEHTLTLVTFSSAEMERTSIQIIIYNEPINQIGKFTKYSPYGGTPLYDAMGDSLTTLYDYIKDDKDATAVVTVLTDGEENSSKRWSARELSKLINRLKEQGWSFAYMGSAHNVKQVTDLLSIENVIEFSHTNTGAENIWARERSSRASYYKKMNAMYSKKEEMTEKEMIRRKREYARSYYSPRVTPKHIAQLKPDEVFVFGSNAKGYHNGGAAALAKERFGAIEGQGEGLQGNSYAIPTTSGLEELSKAVDRFEEFAFKNKDKRFFVTRIGCGSAGFSPRDIAPLFAHCIELENVALPIEFWNVLGINM